MSPWAQPPAVPPGTPPKVPPEEKKSWWERGAERFGEAGGWTWPWEEEHWTAPQPEWTRTVGKAGLGLGLAAGGAALGGAALPAVLGGASGFAPWLTGPALTAMAHPTALGLLGGLGGLTASSVMAPGGLGEPVPPAEVAPGVPPAIPGAPTPAGPPTLPMPGEGMGMGPEGEPQVVTVGGQQFWWNPTGGLYGTGGWDTLPAARAPGLSVEQQVEQARLDREAAERRAGISAGMAPEQQLAEMQRQREWEAQQATAQRASQMQMLQAQGGLEQQLLGAQAGYAREQQAAGAAQQMAQMYAADPYKYWAQMGGGTPESVAALMGGQAPLSMPSQQWWGNLLPSEQQQIMGGVNWLGMDPQDWLAMRQRMIPGLGARQMGPQWAR